MVGGVLNEMANSFNIRDGVLFGTAKAIGADNFKHQKYEIFAAWQAPSMVSAIQQAEKQAEDWS